MGIDAMKRSPRHGELRSKEHPESYRIWLDRDQEPEPIPEFGLMSDYVSDPSDEEIQDFSKRLWRLLETLIPQQEKVIRLRFEGGYTLQEIGEFIGVTTERVRQIEAHALRNLRKPGRVGRLGEPPFPLRRRFVPAVYAWEGWE